MIIIDLLGLEERSSFGHIQISFIYRKDNSKIMSHKVLQGGFVFHPLGHIIYQEKLDALILIQGFGDMVYGMVTE